MKNLRSWLFTTITLLAISTPHLAEACSCIADPYSKKYQVFKKTWYGSKRHWTCEYTCQDGQQKQTVLTGNHKDWYTTDFGLEGICDGLYYENKFNSYKMDSVWVYKEPRWFNPAESSSSELKKWYKNNCK